MKIYEGEVFFFQVADGYAAYEVTKVGELCHLKRRLDIAEYHEPMLNNGIPYQTLLDHKMRELGLAKIFGRKEPLNKKGTRTAYFKFDGDDLREIGAMGLKIEV